MEFHPVNYAVIKAPCCLDGNACISLGNILVQDISNQEN